MKNYKDLYKKIKIHGAGGGSPTSQKLMPPDRTNAKESYSLSRSVDIISEGPIKGLVDNEGLLTFGTELLKEPNTESTTQDEVGGIYLTNFPEQENGLNINKAIPLAPAGSSYVVPTGAKIKILLVIDQSGSYNNVFESVANNIESFVVQLRAYNKSDVEIAVFGFEGTAREDYIKLGYTKNYEAVKNAILNAFYVGGEEDGNEAIINALRTFPGANEVILCTDEEGTDVALNPNARAALSTAGARCHVCASSLTVGQLFANYGKLARSSGGLALIGSASSVFSSIVNYIGDRSVIAENVYRSFSGNEIQMRRSDVIVVVFDGEKWLITDDEGGKIYFEKSGFANLFNNEVEWQARDGIGVGGFAYPASSRTIDKGIYFNEKQVKDNFAKYKFSFRNGEELQEKTSFLSRTARLFNHDFILKGPYNFAQGAVGGSGSIDVRNKGISGRDFSSWQNYHPKQRDEIPFTHEITDQNIEKVDITIQVDQLNDTHDHSPAGDAKSGKGTLGRQRATNITFRVRVEEQLKNGRTRTPSFSLDLSNTDKQGFTLTESQTYTNARVISLTGICTAPYEFTIRDVILPEVTDDTLLRKVIVTKTTVETTSSIINRDARVKYVSEISKHEYSYPFSAVIASEIDARALTSVPNRTFAIKGKKILVPSNYFPIGGLGDDRRFSEDGSTLGNVIYDGGWDGTFKLEWSDNPAWILYDILTSYRYGTAIYNREIDKINIWSLYEIGRYCDAVDADGKFVGLSDGFGGLEPRFSFNHSFKEEGEAFDIIKNIAKSMRALAFYQNSQIQFRIDKPEDPVMLFNNLNVRDGIFSYSDTNKSSRVTAAEVSFLDKKNNFRPRTEYADDEDAIENLGYRKEVIDGIGITSRGQAHRAARTALFESNNATESVSFQVGLEGLILEPGDIIEVNDEVKSLHKNFGKFLGISGLNFYKNGAGPLAIITDKTFSNVTGLVETGSEITLYTPRGTTGIDELYAIKEQINIQSKPGQPTLSDRDSFISQEEISGLRNPQISKFQLDTGANFIEEFDDHLLFRLNTGQDYPKDMFGFSPNSVASLEVTGRNKKLYRVLNVEENEEKFYEVGALIHHTGKYAYIEEGASFDKNLDKFEAGFKESFVSLPNRPDAVATGTISGNVDSSINVPINISRASVNFGDEYNIFLTKPNGESNINPFVQKITGDVTEFTFEDLKQIGDYTAEVFSKSRVTDAISSTSRDVTFNLGFADFDVDPTQDSYLKYDNIILETVFDSNFETGSLSGSGNNSFPQDNETLYARVDLEVSDIFGDSAFNNPKNYNIEQKINLLDENGTTLKENFKILGNDSELEISVEDVYSGFGYTGTGRFIITDDLSIEIGKVSNINRASGVVSGSFAETFTENPVLLFTNEFSGTNEADIKPLSISGISNSGYEIVSYSTSDQNYKYMAFSSGNYFVNGNQLKINTIQKTGFDFQRVEFSGNFSSTPNVFVQCQEDIFPVQTYITGIDTSGFSFDAINSTLFKQTGVFGFLAIEESKFNQNLTLVDFGVSDVSGDTSLAKGMNIFQKYSGYDSGVATIDVISDFDMEDFATNDVDNFTGANTASNGEVLVDSLDLEELFANEKGLINFFVSGKTGAMTVDLADYFGDSVSVEGAQNISDGANSFEFTVQTGKDLEAASFNFETSDTSLKIEVGQIEIFAASGLSFPSGGFNAENSANSGVVYVSGTGGSNYGVSGEKTFVNFNVIGLTGTISGELVSGEDAMNTVSTEGMQNIVEGLNELTFNLTGQADRFVFVTEDTSLEVGVREISITSNDQTTDSSSIFDGLVGNSFPGAVNYLSTSKNSFNFGSGANTDNVFDLFENENVFSIHQTLEDNNTETFSTATGNNTKLVKQEIGANTYSGIAVTGETGYIFLNHTGTHDIGTGNFSLFFNAYQEEFNTGIDTELSATATVQNGGMETFNSASATGFIAANTASFGRVWKSLDSAQSSGDILKATFNVVSLVGELSGNFTTTVGQAGKTDEGFLPISVGQNELTFTANDDCGVFFFETYDTSLSTQINDIRIFKVEQQQDLVNTMNFTNNPTREDFVVLDQNITLDGDFEIEFSTVVTNFGNPQQGNDSISGAHFLTDSRPTRDGRIFFRNDSQKYIAISTENVLGEANSFHFTGVTGQRYDFNFKRVGSTVTASANGTGLTAKSPAGSSDTIVFNSISVPAGWPTEGSTAVPPLNGTIFDVSIKSGSDFKEVYRAGGYGIKASNWSSSVNGININATISGTPQLTNTGIVQRRNAIISKLNTSGFALYEETGNIKLFLSDEDGNSGLFTAFTGIEKNQKNHFALNIDREVGMTSYINGVQNLFEPEVTGITGSLSNGTGISFLGEENSSNYFANLSNSSFSGIVFDYIGFTKDNLTTDEIQQTQKNRVIQFLDNQGSALHLRGDHAGFEGVDGIYDMYNLLERANVTSNVIATGKNTKTTETTGSGSFNFISITGLSNFSDVSLVTGDDFPTLKFVNYQQDIPIII